MLMKKLKALAAKLAPKKKIVAPTITPALRKRIDDANDRRAMVGAVRLPDAEILKLIPN